MLQAEAVVDLDAIRANVAHLASRTSAAVMSVVKADGYGHGMVPVATAALQAGASWLGVTTVHEAKQLREAGIQAPILAWLLSPGHDLATGIIQNVDLSAASVQLLNEIERAAEQTNTQASVHLKVDTGLGRGGAAQKDWPDLLTAAAKAAAAGTIRITGLWSHLALADQPGHPSIERQRTIFEQAIALAAGNGIEPPVKHLANSAGTLASPNTHYDLVRPGIACYGLSPIAGYHGLRPAMTLRATVMLTKRVPKGHGVGYGHTYTTSHETTLAVVPLGYADGIPRAAGNTGVTSVNGKTYEIAGRVSMDQIVLDVGDDAIEAGDDAVIFGPGDGGEPTADDWAHIVDTINYEIVSRIGIRVPRTYRGDR